MSNYSSLKSAIDANIKANGRREITGPVLNAILNAVVNSLGDGYLFRGVAIPSTNPGTPDQNVAYLAITEGTYTHMGGLSVTDGELSVFSYNGAWSKIPLALVPTKTSQLDNDLRFVTSEEMGESLSSKQDTIQDLSEIRSGAALGATAYQKPSAGIPSTDMTQAVQNSLQLADNSDHRPYNSSNPDGMGYLVLKKNKTFAEQVTDTNTVYEIRYDFDLDGASVTIPVGCVLKFNGGKISNGTIVLGGTELSGKVSLDVNCSGTCLNPSAWQGWFSSVDKFIGFINNVDGPQEYNFKPGTYNADEYINKLVDSYIRINGNGCVLNFTSKSAIAAIYLHPKNYEILGTSAVTVAVVPGDKTIQVADTSVFNVGDYISIRDTRSSSFSFCRDYQQGEFASIIAIDPLTNTLTIDHPFYGNYAITDSFVYSYSGISVEIANISLICNGGTLGNPSFGIYYDRTIGTVCDSISVEGFLNGVGIYYSTNVLVKDCSVNCPAIGATRDGYGLQIGNSQGCRVNGGKYVGRNHGISIGGSYTGEFAIVNRDIIIAGTESVSTHSGETWGSLDCHGNSEYITFSDNICTGVNFGGRYISILRNTCIGVNGIYGTELISLNNKIEGNSASRICIKLEAGTGVTTNWTPETKTELLDIVGNVIDYYGTGYSTGITFNPDLSSIYTNISNVVIRYKANNLKGKNATLVFMGFGSTTSAVDSTKTGKVIFEDNIINVPTEYQRQIIAGEIILRNNRIVAMNQPFLTYCNNLHIEGNIIDATRSFADQNSDAARVEIVNNTVNSGRAFSGSKLIGKLLVSGNVISGAGGVQITNITYSETGNVVAIVTNNSVWDSSDITLGNVTYLSHGMNASFNNGVKVIPSATATTVVDLSAQ